MLVVDIDEASPRKLGQWISMPIKSTNYHRPVDQFDIYQIEKPYKTRQNIVVICPCCRC